MIFLSFFVGWWELHRGGQDAFPGGFRKDESSGQDVRDDAKGE
jgi:hypothetical protein